MKAFRDEVAFTLDFKGRVGVFSLKKEGRTLSVVSSKKIPTTASVMDGLEVELLEQGVRPGS